METKQMDKTEYIQHLVGTGMSLHEAEIIATNVIKNRRKSR